MAESALTCSYRKGFHQADAPAFRCRARGRRAGTGRIQDHDGPRRPDRRLGVVRPDPARPAQVGHAAGQGPLRLAAACLALLLSLPVAGGGGRCSGVTKADGSAEAERSVGMAQSGHLVSTRPAGILEDFAPSAMPAIPCQSASAPVLRSTAKKGGFPGQLFGGSKRR